MLRGPAEAPRSPAIDSSEMMKPNNMERVGLHLMHAEGDLLVMEWVGDLLPEHIRAMHARMESMLGEHDFVFLIINAGSGRYVAPETRKLAVRWGYFHRFGGVAFFDASLTTRAAATIASALQRLVSPQNAVPVKFADTEQAARAWIDARRRELGSRARST
jgi:hypothetical protein